MGYKIGSFNMCKYSDPNSKDLEKIANIIKSEQFDILALQEVFNKYCVAALTRYLYGWDYRWKKPQKSSSNAAEGFAFIWNKKRIGLSYTEEDGLKKIFEPRILDQYKVDKAAGQSTLIRNPFYGRFTPNGCLGGCFAEFRLINTHINFGKKEVGDEEVDSSGAITQRNKEYDVIAKAIYPKYADKRYGNNMPAYTVILGDYNLNLRESNRNAAHLKNQSVLLRDAGNSKLIQTFQSELSTISTQDYEGEKPNKENEIYANNYDHFSFDVLNFNDNDINVDIGRVDVVRKYYEYNRDRYKEEVSDHIPVYITVDF